MYFYFIEISKSHLLLTTLENRIQVSSLVATQQQNRPARHYNTTKKLG